MANKQQKKNPPQPPQVTPPEHHADYDAGVDVKNLPAPPPLPAVAQGREESMTEIFNLTNPIKGKHTEQVSRPVRVVDAWGKKRK